MWTSSIFQKTQAKNYTTIKKSVDLQMTLNMTFKNDSTTYPNVNIFISSDSAYINCITIEKQKFTVKLS